MVVIVGVVAVVVGFSSCNLSFQEFVGGEINCRSDGITCEMDTESNVKVGNATKPSFCSCRIARCMCTECIHDRLSKAHHGNLLFGLDDGHGTGEQTGGCARNEGRHGHVGQRIVMQIVPMTTSISMEHPPSNGIENGKVETANGSAGQQRSGHSGVERRHAAQVDDVSCGQRRSEGG